MTTPSEMYASNGGVACPCCDSRNIEGGAIEIDYGAAWQEVTCKACGATWNDEYDLIGYSKLEKNNGDQPEGASESSSHRGDESGQGT